MTSPTEALTCADPAWQLDCGIGLHLLGSGKLIAFFFALQA